MEKQYYHLLTDEEIKKLDTWYESDISAEYKQPDWCEHPEATNFSFGCYSLTDEILRKKISEKYCKDCDYFQQPKSI